MTLPNQHAFREGLSREDLFCVVHDTHWTETARYADLVLPAPTYLEKEDLVIPWGHNSVQLSHRVVAPITDSHSEIWVMREIARRLALTEEWLYEDPWPVIELALADALGGGSFESLRSGEMLALKTKPASSYPTPSGKIEFYSSQALEKGWSPLPAQSPLRIDGASYILLASATPKYTSTQFQEVYGPIPAEVMINPQDAARHGFHDGQVVVLVNDRGRVQVKATISDAVPERVLWSPRQSAGLAGEPQNCLTSSRPQEIGGGPRFNSTTVTLCPL
jgi:anaerobic selenocysteine-containing dehydrogenase